MMGRYSQLRVLTRRRIGSWVVPVLVTIYAFIILIPVLWMFVSSFKNNDEIFSSPFVLPAALRWENFVSAWRDAGLGRNFLNSVFVTLTVIPMVLLLASMTSYALSRIEFRGREFLVWFFLGGLMLPLLLGIVPLFALLKQLGFLNTYLGLIITYIPYQLPFTIYLLYPFFKTLPRELEEAAVMDGCSLFGVFWRVMLPLAQAGLITAAIFNFLQLWNEYVLALIIMGRPELRTLPVGIGKLFFRQFYLIQYGVLFAGLVLAAIPAFLAYAIFHRRMVAGMRVGAIKG